MFNRIVTIFIVSLGLSFVTLSAQAVTPKEPLWPSLKIAYFGDKPIRENATDLLVIEAPKRAEDAAIVPISVKLLVPQTADKYITNIHLVIDNIPFPVSQFGHGLGAGKTAFCIFTFFQIRSDFFF